MEAEEARLKQARRAWDKPRQARRQVVANLAEEWDRPDFTLEQKQAAIGQTLTAIIPKPGMGGRYFSPDVIVPFGARKNKKV
jgi:site-specific DNA recombinase